MSSCLDSLYARHLRYHLYAALTVGLDLEQGVMLCPSCYLGAMRPLMPTFTSLLPYLYDRTAHSRLPDSLRT